MTNTETLTWCPNRQGGGPRCTVALRDSAAAWAVALYLYGGPDQWPNVPTLPELSIAYCDVHGEFPRPIDLAVVVPLVDDLMRERWLLAMDKAVRSFRGLNRAVGQAFDAQASRWLSAHWAVRQLARTAGLELTISLAWGDTL